MQQRHSDRQQYFNELANTSRDFYVDYLRPFVAFTPQTRVLEIGCGEGGNLLPFAEMGCQVKGIDLSEGRIEQAREFFAQAGRQGTFEAMNFITAEKPTTDDERFDIVLIHDVIEHIEPSYKPEFLSNVLPFMRGDALLYVGFPAWQMPFGGHQQITRGWASKLPWIHLLPNAVYRWLLRRSGVREASINELMSIKRSKMTIEGFTRLALSTGFDIVKRTEWFINPHYQQKFGLKARRLWTFLGRIPYLRNYYTTSVWFLLKRGNKETK